MTRRELPPTLMPEVLDGLREAVETRAVRDARAVSDAPASRRRPRWPHGLPLLVGGMLVAGTGVAATVAWNPFAGSDPASAPHAIHGPAPAEERAVLAVMRRPQRASDRSPLVAALLAKVRREEMRGVYVDAVRVLGSVPDRETTMNMGGEMRRAPLRGGTIVLFPRTRGTIDRRGAFADDPRVPICLWQVSDAWAHPGGPWSGLNPTPEPVPGQTPMPKPARLEDRVMGGGTCLSMHQLRMKGAWFGGSLSMGHLVGVVPDGVAAVRIATSDKQVITRPVRENVVILDAPGPTHRFHQGSMRWLDASGRVLRRF